MIGGKRVTAPDGTVWRVGRRWLPDKPVLWRPKRRRKRGDGEGLLDIGIQVVDEAFMIVLALIVVVVLLLLVTTVVLPLIVITIELLIVAVLLVGGIAARLLLRRPWTIRARAADGRELTWRAVGFRRSGRVRDDVASALALGHPDVRPSETLP